MILEMSPSEVEEFVLSQKVAASAVTSVARPT